jgi:hypothetical protein
MVRMAPRPFVRMDTTDITHMIARHMATTGRTTLQVECLSALGRGFTATGAAITDAEAAIMAGPGTAIGPATVAGRGTEIAQGTPIGAVRGAAMAVAASAATVRAQSTAVAAPAVTVRAHSTVVVPTVVVVPTAVAAFMVVEATEAATGKSNQVV